MSKYDELKTKLCSIYVYRSYVFRYEESLLLNN